MAVAHNGIGDFYEYANVSTLNTYAAETETVESMSRYKFEPLGHAPHHSGNLFASRHWRFTPWKVLPRNLGEAYQSTRKSGQYKDVILVLRKIVVAEALVEPLYHYFGNELKFAVSLPSGVVSRCIPLSPDTTWGAAAKAIHSALAPEVCASTGGH
jgi:hypothetical protein